jgi:hypothetical protein
MIGAPVSGLTPTTSLNCKDESRGTVITVAIFFTSFFRTLIQAKLSSVCYILPYLTIFIKYKASSLIYINKGVFFFDFLINAPYFIKLKKGSFPIQEGPLVLQNIVLINRGLSIPFLYL